MSNWYILGIDLGIHGFACLKEVGSNRVKCVSTPMASPPALRNVLTADEFTNVEDYDVRRMHEIAKKARDKADGLIVAVMEQPFFRKTSNNAVVSLLRAQGYWAAACGIAGIPAFYLDATSWKSRIGIKAVTDKIKDSKERAKKSKELAVEIANGLVGWGQFVSHDAAEAFLIAYCLETYYDEKFGWLKKAIP